MLFEGGGPNKDEQKIHVCILCYVLPVAGAIAIRFEAMSLQTLLEAPHITIAYDHLNEWLLADWHGNQDLASVQQGSQEILRLMQLQRCHKVLNDNTRVTSMWSEAAEWAGKDLFPALAAAGLRYFAWVYSPNLYSRLSTDLTLQFAAGSPVVATFDDVDTAQGWLKQM
jgi:hypothetical protein